MNYFYQQDFKLSTQTKNGIRTTLNKLAPLISILKDTKQIKYDKILTQISELRDSIATLRSEVTESMKISRNFRGENHKQLVLKILALSSVFGIIYLSRRSSSYLLNLFNTYPVIESILCLLLFSVEEYFNHYFFQHSITEILKQGNEKEQIYSLMALIECELHSLCSSSENVSENCCKILFCISEIRKIN